MVIVEDAYLAVKYEKNSDWLLKNEEGEKDNAANQFKRALRRLDGDSSDDDGPDGKPSNNNNKCNVTD